MFRAKSRTYKCGPQWVWCLCQRCTKDQCASATNTTLTALVKTSLPTFLHTMLQKIIKKKNILSGLLRSLSQTKSIFKGKCILISFSSLVMLGLREILMLNEKDRCQNCVWTENSNLCNHLWFSSQSPEALEWKQTNVLWKFYSN